MEFDIWKLLASKWTMFVLALAMGGVLPMLWKNTSVVWSTANVPSVMLWQHTIVFALAVLTMLMAMFKGLSAHNAEKGNNESNTN